MRMRGRLTACVTVVASLGATVAFAASDVGATQRRSTSRTPSGQAIPVGNLAGWKQVFRDDFGGTRLSSKWFSYSGEPGGNGGGWWDPSHAVIHAGMLVLKTYRDPVRCTNASICSLFNDEVSGVVQSESSQLYGKYLIRVRTTPVRNVFFVALLFPLAHVWPPETDFAEEGGISHLTTIGATLQEAPNDRTAQNDVRANAARWHTLGVEWSPGKVVYTIDGRAWATEVTPAVSSIPMRIVLQSQTDCQAVSGQTCPDPWRAKEPDVDVDWVVAYSRAG